MPLGVKFRSRTSSDAEIIEKSRKIAKDLGESPEQCDIFISFRDNGTNGLVDVEGFNSSDIENQPLVSHAREHYGEALWARVVTNLTSKCLSIRIDRYSADGLRTIDDEVVVDYVKQEHDIVRDDHLEASRAFSLVQEYFVPYSHPDAIKQALGPEFSEHYSRRDEELSRLENLAQRITEDTHGHRKKLDAEYEERKKELNQSIKERRFTLQQDHSRRQDELITREEELEKRKKDLDDRTARHARREQSRRLQEKIASRTAEFTLTRGTQKKRRPVHCIFIVLLAMTATLVALSQFVPASATDGLTMWLEVIRLPIGTLGFVFTAIFYIRWTDHWFRQHADQEFRLQQLALDVDRAGYATEMLLEWQEDKDGEMPAVMVDRLTTGLFVDQSKSGQVQHPTEDIIDKLFKATSNVELDIPGFGKLTVPGRKLRKLGNDE